MRLYALADFYSERLGKAWLGAASALIMFVAYVFAVTAQIVAGSRSVHVVFGWDYAIAAVVTGLIIVFYTVLGGLWAVSLTDFLQFLITFIRVSALILLPNIGDAELAYPALIKEVLSAGIAGVVLSGLMAAVMSNADSMLPASATVLAKNLGKDLLEPGMSDSSLLLLTRSLVAVLGIFAIAAAVARADIMYWLVLAFDVLFASCSCRSPSVYGGVGSHGSVPQQGSSLELRRGCCWSMPSMCLSASGGYPT